MKSNMVSRAVNEEEKNIGLKLLYFRRVLGIKQFELADAISVSPQTLSLIENGKSNLSPDIARKLILVASNIIRDKEAKEIEEYELFVIEDFIESLESFAHKDIKYLSVK